MTALIALGFRGVFHRCLDGRPLTQWLVPTTCATALVLFARRPGLAVSLAATFIVTQIFLVTGFNEIVHTSEFTGNTSPMPLDTEDLRATLFDAEFGAGLSGETVVEEGWLFDELPASARDEEPRFYHAVRSRWHTPLTGIHSRVPLRVWHPGGELAAGLDRVELREFIDAR